MCPRKADQNQPEGDCRSPTCDMGRDCAVAVCTVGEGSDSDSGFDEGVHTFSLLRGLQAKSWPCQSAQRVREVRFALSAVPRSRSIRFADSYGLPLVSVFHYRHCDSVDEFRGSIQARKAGSKGSGWSSARAAMEDMWSLEDGLELSLYGTGSGVAGGRMNSWDLPSTRRLRRASASAASPSKAAAPTVGSRLASESRLCLEGGPLKSGSIKDCLGQHHVALEYISFQDAAIFGSVVVNNIAFEKQVCVRYTLNKWKTSSDLNAAYVTGSTAQDSSTDRFSFSLVLPLPTAGSDPELRMEFAVCFKAASAEHWDSNSGSNYAIVMNA